MTESSQDPKPAYGDVTSNSGELIFQLYFDGGGERKLQLKRLDIRFCVVHAVWMLRLAPTREAGQGHAGVLGIDLDANPVATDLFADHARRS